MPSAEKVGRVIPNAPPRRPHDSDVLPRRKALPHTPPPWVQSGEIFFITICCAERKTNSLARDEPFRIMIASLEYHIGAGNLWTHLFIAMPDHLHALMSFSPEQPMAAFIRSWKRFIAKKTGIVWQDGFFDHRLRPGENFDEKVHYIRMNPVRAGLVSAEDAAAWTYAWTPAHVAPAR